MSVAIGARLRVLRKARGISQVELAHRLGVSFQSVQNYERGTNRPAASTVARAARALGVSVGELLEEQAEARPPSDFHWSLLTPPGAADLLRAFGRIAKPEHRAAVLEIARTLAESEGR